MFCFSSTFAISKNKRIYTTKKTEKPPIIDGYLELDIWNQVKWSGDFIQHTPNEGEAPFQRTAFLFLFNYDQFFVFRSKVSY